MSILNVRGWKGAGVESGGRDLEMAIKVNLMIAGVEGGGLHRFIDCINVY